MKHERKNLSDLKGKKIYRKRTRETWNRFYKSKCKIKLKIPEAEKEKELGRKKVERSWKRIKRKTKKTVLLVGS